MVGFPGCKINLGLSVTSKRPDGFHDIETVMVPVKLSDVLEIIPGDGEKMEFNISGNQIPGAIAENLVCKAYAILKEDYDLPIVSIHLHKVVPMGAGLGGGSADAACMLKLLNSVFDLRITNDKLAGYAKRLGSDCPFFIESKPVFATGRGDLFEPIPLDLASTFITVVMPGFTVSTKDAYSIVMPVRKEKTIRDIISEPVEHWKGILVNDFEEALSALHPEIEKIKSTLYSLGAVYASLTGSGSALYGIFRERVNTADQFEGCSVFANCRVAM